MVRVSDRDSRTRKMAKAYGRGHQMIVHDCKSLGKEIKKRRKQLGYTQQYISDYTGFSVSFLSALENGKETAELGKALYIVNMLGMDMSLDRRG